jgi:signal transduction histidine kinase
LLGDGFAAVGLVLLYVMVTTLGVLFYRTRYAVVHAQAEGRAKGLFLARMSHEIRTPLNGVIGLAELLADTDPTPRQREYIELITSAGRSLISLVNDILDHAKIEAGKLEIERVSIDIRTLVSESAQVFGLRAGQNRTLIFCHADPDVPDYLLGDPIRIRQVLLNLVANAVKFTEQGRVEVSVEQTSGNDGARRLRVEVRDTGIGLTPGEQQGLFTLFTQASSEVTRRFGGTGLGLSISRELVQLMGGNIGVYSGVGPGSVFWFELPLVAVPGTARQPDTSAALRRRYC